MAVASEPQLEHDTYGGETIRFRVEFSELVTVGGQPHFTFSLGNRNAGRRVDAAYESGNRTTALVFGTRCSGATKTTTGSSCWDFAERAGPVGLGGGLILRWTASPPTWRTTRAGGRSAATRWTARGPWSRSPPARRSDRWR